MRIEATFPEYKIDPISREQSFLSLIEFIYRCIRIWESKNNEDIYAIIIHSKIFYEIINTNRYDNYSNGVVINLHGNMTVFGHKVITTNDIAENLIVVF
jgi:hypothetical protein